VKNGAAHLCSALLSRGVTHAFGVPGSQDLVLYEALRQSGIRSVLTTNELAAGFMANGYYRASGRLAALITIPGPGFTWALTSIAEALQDSVAVLHLVGRPPGPDHRLHLQAIDQEAVAAPLIKGAFRIDAPGDIECAIGKAVHLALEGEPGPVVVEWTRYALEGGAVSQAPGCAVAPRKVEASDLAVVVTALANAKYPVILVGQGAIDAAPLVRELAETLGAPVFSTASGRGVLPEDHALALCFDGERGNVDTINELLALSDLVLVLGCKLGYSGTTGFQLKLPSDRVVRVDASEDVLRVTCPARLAFVETVEAFLKCIVPELAKSAQDRSCAWTTEEISRWTMRLRRPAAELPEPVVQGTEFGRVAHFFGALRRVLPRGSIVCADSGLHQQLLRRYFDVLAPRGLLFPSDYQSMGYCLPAAIGAKLAAPDRPVVAVIGDGGFALSGLELLTAVRENLSLTVVVFNDGYLGRIRMEQLAAHGRMSSVGLQNPDFEAFAVAVGAAYQLVEGNPESMLRECVERRGVTLVELRLGDSAGTHVIRARGLGRNVARKVLGEEMVKKLRRLLPRGVSLIRAPFRC
jgi:acetolactate synthase I/II/III large subunit